MKTTKFFMLAALALSATACSNDSENEYTGPVEAKITAGLAGAQTRAVDDKWNSDNIGVMVKDAPSSDMENLYKNVKYSTYVQSTTATFTAETGKGIFFQDAGETVTFAAYAPYQTSAANALPGTNSDGIISVNTKENNTSDKQESIDFLYASGATASRTNPTVSFTNNGSDCSFHHKMARLDLVLKVSTTDGFNPEQIIDDGNLVTLDGLKHQGTFNVTTGEAKVTPESSMVIGWDITHCKHGDVCNEYTGYTRTYSLILLPQTTGEPLPLTINIDEQNYKNTRSIHPALEAGHVYTYTITVKKTGLEVGTCTITNWNDGGSQAGDAVMPTN